METEFGIFSLRLKQRTKLPYFQRFFEPCMDVTQWYLVFLQKQEASFKGLMTTCSQMFQ